MMFLIWNCYNYLQKFRVMLFWKNNLLIIIYPLFPIIMAVLGSKASFQVRILQCSLLEELNFPIVEGTVEIINANLIIFYVFLTLTKFAVRA